MIDINSYDKFIASRFVLEYGKVEFASLLGVSVSKITNIEGNKSSIPYIYSLAINQLLEEHPMWESALKALETHDTIQFARRIDLNTRIQRLACKRCSCRKLHIMVGGDQLYFVECMGCHHTMYFSGPAVKRYLYWTHHGVTLNHNLYS